MIAAIVQARMSSSRLPGKVLRPLAGRPLLVYVLERLERAERVGPVVVATSEDEADDAIADFCAAVAVACHRGPLLDVAGRLLDAAEAQSARAFVRVSADSPLLDPQLVDRGVSLYTRGRCDLVTNVLPRTFPKGQSVEVIDVAALRAAHAAMQDPQELEHVTAHFYRAPAEFAIRSFTAAADFSSVRHVVDSEADAGRLEELLDRMERPHWDYGWQELLELESVAAH